MGKIHRLADVQADRHAADIWMDKRTDGQTDRPDMLVFREMNRNTDRKPVYNTDGLTVVWLSGG